MDVLKPDLLWINGKCYRIPYNNNTGSNDLEVHKRPHCEEYEDFEGPCDGSSEDEDVEMELMDSGRLRTFLRVPEMFFGCIIGARGETKKLIEAETGTIITIPKNKVVHNSEIMITGPKRNGIVRARRRLMMKVLSARQKQRPTHFLSIPMTSKPIQNSFLKFKDDVCQNSDYCNERIDSSIFQSPMKLHLTLGTMVLGDDFEVKQVAEMLKRFKEGSQNALLVSGEPLSVRLQGVEYMNDDPTQVDVLYGRVRLEDGSDNLQRLADDMFSVFSQKGFIVERRENVKLHVTLMNTLFRDELNEAGIVHLRKKQRETFDAKVVLKKYRDFDFGVQRVDSVHLSKRFSSNSEGYYQMVGSMKI